MKVKRTILSMLSALVLAIVFMSQSVFAYETGTWKFTEINAESFPSTISEENPEFGLTPTNFAITQIGNQSGSRILNAYCAMANVGFENRTSWASDASKYEDTYTIKYNMNTEQNLVQGVGMYTDSTKYKQMLALADLFYLGNSDDELEAYLKPLVDNGTLRYDDYTYAQLKAANALITPNQIRAAQQTALWYFTNEGIDYTDVEEDNIADEFLYYRTTNTTYTSLGNNSDNIKNIQNNQAKQLYKYLVNTAKTNAANSSYTNVNTVYLYLDNTTDDEQPIIEIEKGTQEFDLALRKFITKINDTNITNRVPVISNNNNENVLENLEDEITAKKEHTKAALPISKGDRVTYTIRIYNEGDVNGYATKITDYLPAGLTLASNSTTNTTYGWSNPSGDGKTIETSYLADKLIIATNREFSKFNDDDAAEKYYYDLQIECIVNNNATNDNLINIAEITADSNNDVDSTPDSLTDGQKSNYNPEDSEKGRGYEDDDDYEPLRLREFDLALRKYIAKVGTTEYEEPGARKPDDDTTRLNKLVGDINLDGKIDEEDTTMVKNHLIRIVTLTDSQKQLADVDGDGNVDTNDLSAIKRIVKGITSPYLYTTAIYNHKKDPIEVETGVIVTYKLVIYNEGEIDGRATTVIDQLPEGVEFVEVVSGNFTGTATNNKLTLTRKSSATTDLKAFDGTTLDSEVIEIKCRVTAVPDVNSDKVFTNLAWIANHTSGDGTYTYEDRDSNKNGNNTPNVPTLVTTDNGYTNNDNHDLDDVNHYFEGQEDDDDFEKVILKPKRMDLALRKFITAINDVEPENSREPKITGAPLDSENTTAVKNHPKNKLSVAKGNTVLYTIRIYNEGKVDGYATEVTDYLPDGLSLKADSTINTQFGWQADEEDSQIIRTNYLNRESGRIIKAVDREYIKFNETDAEGKYYWDLQVECIVNEKATKDNLKNIAEITDAEDKNGNKIDEDSTPDNLTDGQKTNYSPEDSEIGRGYEDDDDFEDLQLVELDLALRKFITRVADNENMTDAQDYNRAPVYTFDTPEKFIKGEITTATYNHTKQPVEVNVGDYVEYTLRVYNEGSMDAYAREITDHLPEYLEYVDCDLNSAYNWNVDEDNSRTITTDYLKATKLNAVKYLDYDGGGNEGRVYNGKIITLDSTSKLDELELKIICKVIDTVPYETNQTNIAEITKYGDKDNTPLDVDRDSETIGEGLVKLPTDTELPDYKKAEIDDQKATDVNKYIPGQQDDDDFEKVFVHKFDLALRKFITKVETKDGNDRYSEADYAARVPQISQESYEKLRNGETTTLEYSHSKDAMDTVNTDIVTYTLRIYNEGNKNGYASVITDDIPDGVVFIPENETNKEYRWVMYAELPEGVEVADPSKVVELNINGTSEVKKYVETTDATKAVIIRTDYLSKEQGEARMTETDTVNPNLIKALDLENGLSDTNPDYKDIKVAFRVVEPNGSKRILINYAQISDDQDEYGNPVKDIDSTPDRWNDGEDDQDIEKIKVPEFDLALRKWVTQAIVTENGKTTVTNTGHDAWDDPEAIVKVELHRKKLSNVTVKFRYSIRVYNQGELEGYAKEVTDYIPEGLKFVAEDNPGWTDEGNNVISTKALENTLLKPGEYADVEVLLTWINGNDNLGLKVNTAEISEDYNEWGVPDKDSTPDNKKPGEDDIDDAPVMLSVSTGMEATYIILGTSILLVLAGGIFLIKKYVL